MVVTLAGCTAGRSLVILASWTKDSKTITSAVCSGETVDIHGSPYGNASLGYDQQMLSIKQLQGSGDKTITITLSGTAYANNVLMATEFIGGDTTTWFEAVSTAQGNSTNPAVSHTTLTDNALVMAIMSDGVGSTTAGSGFTLIDPSYAFVWGEYDLDAESAGAKTVSFTSASAQWSIVAASFRFGTTTFTMTGAVAVGVAVAATTEFTLLTVYTVTGSVATGVAVAASVSFTLVTVYSITGAVATAVAVSATWGIMGITASDGVATVALTAHGFSDGDPVTIAGANQSAYNGTFNITYIGPNSFSYLVSGSPASPATGTITATGYNESYFPAVAYAQYNNLDLVLHETTGKVYSLEIGTYQDDGLPINVIMRTAPWDGGTQHWKMVKVAALIGDKVSSSALLRYSDDDYTTYSTYRPLDLSVERAKVTRLGRTAKRAWEVRHTANTALRSEALEIEADKGN